MDRSGGLEGHIFLISKGFVDAGHNVTIFDRKYSESDLPVEVVDGVRIVRLPTTNFRIGPFGRKYRTIQWSAFMLDRIVFWRKVSKYLGGVTEIE